MPKVFARIRIELDDNTKKYRLLFELLTPDGTVEHVYPVPSLAIIDTFKQMAIADADGYTDVLANVKPIKLDDRLSDIL